VADGFGMGSPAPDGAARAAEALERAATAPDLLRATAVALVELLGARACTVSRVVGDVLVVLAEHAPGGETLQLGQGFLIPDFPLTQEVIARGESRAVSLRDDDPDPREAALLEELGFDSLLMLPLPVQGQCWALVEVMGSPRSRFGEEDARLGEALVARCGALLEQLL
jgi:GAF domain-containing protein